MYNDFGTQVGGNYPSTIVIRLDTMEIVYFAQVDIAAATSTIQSILDEEHDPCSEL